MMDDDVIFTSEPFDKLISVVGAEKIIVIGQQFLDQATTRMQTIQKAINQKDVKILESETHALGSSAGMFGLQRMHVLSRATEKACVDGKLDEAVRLCEDVLSIADESFKAVREFLDNADSST